MPLMMHPLRLVPSRLWLLGHLHRLHILQLVHIHEDLVGLGAGLLEALCAAIQEMIASLDFWGGV